MMRICKLLAGLMIAGAPICAALADDAIAVLTPAYYLPGASVVNKVKQECGIEQMVASRTLAALGKQGMAATAVTDAASAGATPVISLGIAAVGGVGGGGWTGPKWLTLKAEIVQQGKVSRMVQLTRTTTGGVFGGFKGTCSLIDRCATKLAEDIAHWAKDPKYQPEGEKAPTDAPPASEAEASPATSK